MFSPSVVHAGKGWESHSGFRAQSAFSLWASRHRMHSVFSHLKAMPELAFV